MIQKIGILTSGGDSQGMNAAIAGIIKTANVKGIEIYIIKNGYLGLVNNWIEKIDNCSFIDNFIKIGGTILGSSRFPEFKDVSVRKKALINLNILKIEALIIIGGNGSYLGAQRLTEMGINCVCLPATIDNDIGSSDYTIGFDTAINVVVEAIDRIRDTMQSHNRCAIIEVMGRYCGDIALYGGIAGGADIISIFEMALTEDEIIKRVKRLRDFNKRSVVIVVSEMIYPNLYKLAEKIEKISGYVTKVTVLGYTQRGGVPTAMERFRAFRMAQFAVYKLLELDNKCKFGLAIANSGDQLVSMPIIEALNIHRKSRREIWNQFDELININK